VNTCLGSNLIILSSALLGALAGRIFDHITQRSSNSGLIGVFFLVTVTFIKALNV
jgi:hypothetical protein